MNVLEKEKAITILLALYKMKSVATITDIINSLSISSPTFYKRKNELVEAGLIKIEEKPTEKNGKLLGKTVYLSLTPKGKKVAKKLLEIKEIMENE